MSRFTFHGFQRWLIKTKENLSSNYYRVGVVGCTALDSSRFGQVSTAGVLSSIARRSLNGSISFVWDTVWAGGWLVGIPQAGLRGVLALGAYPLISFAGCVWLLYGWDEITALLRAVVGLFCLLSSSNV